MSLWGSMAGMEQFTSAFKAPSTRHGRLQKGSKPHVRQLPGEWDGHMRMHVMRKLLPKSINPYDPKKSQAPSTSKAQGPGHALKGLKELLKSLGPGP